MKIYPCSKQSETAPVEFPLTWDDIKDEEGVYICDDQEPEASLVILDLRHGARARFWKHGAEAYTCGDRIDCRHWRRLTNAKLCMEIRDGD